MAPAVVAALISAAASLYGQYKGQQASNEATSKQLANERQKQQDLDNWYNRNYNQDPTMRADAQRILRQMEERMKKSNRAAAGRAAVMGGTEASVAATKEANAKAMADAVSEIYADNEKRKDAIEDRYIAGKFGISDNVAKIESGAATARAQNIAGAVSGIGSAAGSLAGAFSNGSSNTSDTTSEGGGQPVKNTMGNGQPNYGVGDASRDFAEQFNLKK